MGVSGRIARYFLESRLTPLIALLALLLGAFAIVVTPREEEPQINVTMANVLVPFPGASARDVETLVATPAEQVIAQIRDLDHVFSVSKPGLAIITAQFKVGVPRTEALVRLYDTILSNRDWLPKQLNVGEPIIKPKGIDDVPIVTLTLWTADMARGAPDLESVAHAVEVELKRIPGTREVTTIGGPGRIVRVLLDPERLAAYKLAATDVRQALTTANTAMPSGTLVADNRLIEVETGEFLTNAKDVASLVVGVSGSSPVYLSDVAKVVDGPPTPVRYVWFGTGPGAASKGIAGSGEFPAVTIAVTKKPGENAVDVAQRIVARVGELQNAVIPSGVEVTVTRNYGETANDKAIKLIQKLVFATLSVVALVFVTLGRREAAIVGAAVILTLSATLFASWAWGFTLNRVSLFALIFSIGILVDDAIVVVENIHRHRALEPGASLVSLIPRAVDEVGGPTILATLTVIAALLPMAFVTGLMGPYMGPIPINASMGMVISLAIAFTVTPWLALRLGHHGTAAAHQPSRLDAGLARGFAKLLAPFLDEGKGARNRRYLWLGIVAAIALSLFLAVMQWVVLKMLPFDNKSEFQVVVDLPAGTPVENTAAALRAMGAYVATIPEVTDYQGYAGTASPINFNGLVRQYNLRQAPESGDLQVNLVDKHHRDRKSHEIAAAVRPELERIGARFDARVKVVEVPPGPPVLSPLVAEVYGPDEAGRHAVAKRVRAEWSKHPEIVGIDDSIEDSAPKLSVRIDQVRAATLGVAPADIVAAMRLALDGEDVTMLRDGQAKYGVPVRLTLPPERQAKLEGLLGMKVHGSDGALVPLSELVNAQCAGARRHDLPQGPAARVVRDWRRRRQDRQSLVWIVRGAGCAGRRRIAARRPARRIFHPPADGPVPRIRDQVGRRVAGDLRNLPRHGHCLCRGTAADLPAGGRPVRFVSDPLDHHGADPAHDHRRDAGACIARLSVHRDVDDRNDRARGHHRPQFDPAGGFHQPAGGPRRAVRDRGRRFGLGPRQADCPDRIGCHARGPVHPGRSDLQRPGHLAHLRHHGVDAVDPGGDSRVVLRRESRPTNPTRNPDVPSGEH